MSAPAVEWFVSHANMSAIFSIEAYPKIALDKFDNSYVAAITDTVIDPISGNTSSGSYDIYVFKLDQFGNHIWTTQKPLFNTSAFDGDTLNFIGGFDRGNLSIDVAYETGNVYVTYNTTGITTGNTQTGTMDIVVFKLDTNGTHIWTRQSSDFNVPGTNNSPTITVDSNENVYVSCYTDNTLVINTTDIVVFKLDTNGIFLWRNQSSQYNSLSNDKYPSIDVDLNGNIYVAYYTDGIVTGGVKTSSVNDIVVFKLDTDGGFIWVSQQPTFNLSTYDNRTPIIAVNSSGDIHISYVVTYFNVTYIDDIAVFKLDTNGSFQWIQADASFNVAYPSLNPHIAIDNANNVYVSYYIDLPDDDIIIIGGITPYDIAVFKLDSNGLFQWIKNDATINTTVQDIKATIAVNGDGNAFVSFAKYTNVVSTSDIAVFKLGAFVCVAPDTEILMGDNSIKKIQDIKIGDIVAADPNILKTYTVSRLTSTLHDVAEKINICIFDKGSIDINVPYKQLKITTGHPIIYNNTRRSSHFFGTLPDVHVIYNEKYGDVISSNEKINYLYDIQFDTIGSYVANGLTVQSRHPQSYLTPLPKDMYHNKKIYTELRKDDYDSSYEYPLIEEYM